MASTPADDSVRDSGSPQDAPDDDAPANDALDGSTRPEGDETAGDATAAPAGDSDARSGARPVPSEEELERRAVAVRIRRRPRYGVFIVLGMLFAAVAAFVWATQVPEDAHVNWGSTVWVTTLGSLGFGALLGAGVAVFADWLSRRR